MIDNAAFAEGLLAFLNDSPTAFHATDSLVRLLESRGYAELREGDAWEVARGGKYYVRRNLSAVIAFETGTGDPQQHGFRLIGAHTDAPAFKLKPGNALVTGDGYVKLNTETYGGMILSSWFDRPLSIAGRLVLESNKPLRPRELLVNMAKPVAVIPNLSLHFNRDVNSGYAYNSQIDLLPLLGFADTATSLGDYVAELVAGEAGVYPGEIIDYDLYLYESGPGALTGPHGEFISAGRLDNLSMVYSGLIGLLRSPAGNATRVLAAFDNEEVGSGTAAGAASDFLPQVLRRISLAYGLNQEEYCRALAVSMAVSADTAHAVHPNYPEKHDPGNRPVLGGGPVIKYSAAQKYATNAVTAAAFAQVCRAAEVPVQRFVNRSDMAGGSTIGPALSSRTSIPTVDVGTPILAMHSARELGCVVDNVYAARAFAEFFAVE